jgi:hypothetical protein
MAVTLHAYAFVTEDEVKEWIGGKITEVADYDDWVRTLINRVTDYMENSLCYRRILVRSTAEEEVRDGDGSQEMRLWHPPINDLSLIEIKYESDIDATAIADEEQVRMDAAIAEVRLMQRIFTRGYRNITFTYKGGFAAGEIKDHWKQACVMIVKRLYKMQSRSNETLASISRSGETMNFLIEKVIDQDIMRLVSDLIRPRVG